MHGLGAFHTRSDVVSLLADDHERPVAEIIVGAWWTTAVGSTPVRLVPLGVVPPPLPLPSVQENLDLLVPREIPRQIGTDLRLVSRDDDQVAISVSHGCPVGGWISILCALRANVENVVAARSYGP